MTVTLESLRKSIGKKKVNTQAFAWLADFERASGDLDTSLERIDGGLTLYPGDLAAHLVRTKILFEKGDFEACIEECAKVLKMDPFCLSAQKRMGDAYDKVEKINERNQCYRKVHDMDPLDQFWKDEYDAVVAAAAVAAGTELADADLSMPGLGGQDAGSIDFSMGEEAPFFEKSPEDASQPEEKGPKFGSGFEYVNEQPAEESAETATAAPETNDFEAMASEADDPFAALSALIPDSDAGDEAAMDSLQASLDSAMESIGADEPSEPEVFPADDDISGNDVNSAMSNFFGVDDDLEPEEPAAPASPFSNLNLSAGIDDEPAAAANADKVFSAPAAEDKPQSVDDAFGAIFGEDELPEEPAAFQKSAESESAPAAEDKPQSVDDAFGSIFGEDELPEEPAAFQKSAESEPAPAAEDKPQSVDDAFGSIFGEDELPEEPAAFQKSAESEPAPTAEDKPQSVDDAFGSIFGEDELPEEPAVFQKSAEQEKPASEELTEPATEELAEPAADELTLAGDWSPFQKSAEVESAPADAPPAEESSDSVGGAIDSIFGAEDDLPEESGLFQKSADVSMNLTGNTLAEETLDVAEPSVAEPAAELADDLEMPAAEKAAEWTVEPTAEPAAEQTVEPADEPAFEPSADLEMPTEETKEVENSVGNAFSSIFGEDDDLPQENPTVAGEAEAPSAEPVAEVDAPVAETPAEEPVASAESFSETASDFEKEMGGAFDSLFGSDEENTGAAVEEENVPTESLEEDLDKSFDNLFGEEKAETPAPAAETAAPKPDYDNLESEMSSAFKGLFESDDDDLPEEKPSNKGIDFLMSGDSDDEVSAGLIKDPSATLDNVNADMDASQNTRTMAEIFLEQGVYDKALEIYQCLAQKDPENKELQERLDQVRALYNEKFGG